MNTFFWVFTLVCSVGIFFGVTLALGTYSDEE